MNKFSSENQSNGVAVVTPLMLSSKVVIYQLARWVAILSIVVMFLSLMTGVVVRYVLSTNLGWVGEVPNLLFPWFTMGAIVAAAARNEHIGINLVVDHLPRLAHLPVVFATNALAAVGFGVMAYYGLDVIEIAGSQRLPITQISMSWAYGSVVVGFAGMSAVSLINVGLLLIGHDASPVSHAEEEL